MRQVLKGSTNVSVDVYIIDSTNGTPELGVLFNTAGIDLEYRRELAAVVNITEATLAALTTAHADGGFLEIGHGLYRLDVPDAAFATGVETVSIQGTVTGMIVVPQTIQLVDFDPETSMAALVDLIWDEVLTGGTHNVSNSAGRRLRQLQEAGGYTGGHVFIDTVNGAAGTTNFENGVETNPTDSIADANTLATSIGLSRFMLAPGSSITLAATQASQEFEGDNWDLALGGQSVSGSHFTGADVSGTGTGASEIHFEHCEIGNITIAGAHFDDCDIAGTITLSAAATYVLANCLHGGSTPIIDFGGAVGNTTVHIHGWMGALEIRNMGQSGTDVLHFDSAGGQLTLAATCIGGTVNMRGTFSLVNSGSGQTLNRGGDVINDVAAVKVDTAATLVDTNELQADWTNGGRLDLIIDAILVDTGTTLDAAIAVIDTNVDQIETAVITNAAGTDIAADIIALKAETVLIVADTAELQGDWVNGGRLDLILDAILVDTNSLNDTKIPDTISLANINAEVDTALDTAIAELGVAQPSATPSLRNAVMLMYMALRNKLDVQTSGTDSLEIHNAAGTEITQKLITDDGSDYSEAQMT